MSPNLTVEEALARVLADAGPVAGTEPTGRPCHGEPRLTRPKTGPRDGRLTDTRLTINPVGVNTGDALPQVCGQQSVTLTPADTEQFARYRQELRYGTPQHLRVYKRLRQAQEGFHGFAKSHIVTALRDPEDRLVRGKAAQTLFAALLIAAASVAKVREFLENANEDDDGTRWVEREDIVFADMAPPGGPDPDANDPPEQAAA